MVYMTFNLTKWDLLSPQAHSPTPCPSVKLEPQPTLRKTNADPRIALTNLDNI